MRVIEAKDSVDILTCYKKYLIDKDSDEIVIDLKGYQESEDSEVRLVVKLEELAKKKGMNVSFINSNGRIKDYKKINNIK